MPHVIGTAGHVDHGKSALIQALTGIDPDRLAEEKARGLTIDLGFAWTTLPSGREVGFVDVPGHERFVHNMLAGVGGVGCALFVVDASEGWRPQSAEHLAILDLLGIGGGVVALTKADLVDEAALERVAGEVGERLRGTTLAGAELVATAAPSGVGVAELAAALDAALDRLPEPPDRGRPRLPVDRVFTMRGSGTVVTGTLSGGSLRAGGEAELLPAGRRVRVRGLQGHGRPLGEAAPARRVAVNLAGVATGEVARGDVLALPGQWAATGGGRRPAALPARRPRPAAGPRRLPGLRGRGRDRGPPPAARRRRGPPGRRRPGPAAPGAAAGPGRVRAGGAAGQRPRRDRRRRGRPRPVPARGRPRHRRPGPPHRGAGGPRGRRPGRPAGAGPGRARPSSPWPTSPAWPPSPPTASPPSSPPGGRGPAERDEALTAVVRSRTLAWTPTAWEAARAAVLEAVGRQHRADPSAPGLPAQAARAAPAGRPAAAPAPAGLLRPTAGSGPPSAAAAGTEVVEALVAEGRLVADGPTVRLPGHAERLDPAQQALRDRVERAAGAAGVGLLGDAALAELGADRRATALLVRTGVLVAVGPAGYLGRSALEGAVETLRRSFPDGRPFAATEAKEALGTTRRTAIPLLEHLDRTGVTIRLGDLRRMA